MPVAFMALAAVAVAGGAAGSPVRARGAPPLTARPGSPPGGAGIAGRPQSPCFRSPRCSSIAIPLAADTEVRDSRSAVAQGNLGDALARADTAADLQPYAAAPRLQQALVLELRGDLDGAARAARQATERESTNWRTWLIRSRLEARAGRAENAAHAYRKAEALSRTTVEYAEAVNEHRETETGRDAGPERAGQPGGIADELRPYVNRGESEQLNRIGEWLLGRRPVPSAGFRAELHARLSALVGRKGAGARAGCASWRPRTWAAGLR